MTKGKICKICALFLDVSAPFVATLTQFPVWVDKSSEATMSGVFLLFATLSCIPFFKQIKAYFKSPSAWVVWTLLFVFFMILKNIINEMLLVSLVGMAANLTGLGIHKLGDFIDKRDLGGGEDI